MKHLVTLANDPWNKGHEIKLGLNDDDQLANETTGEEVAPVEHGWRNYWRAGTYRKYAEKEQAEGHEELASWFLKNADTKDVLTHLNASPEVDDGRITGLTFYPTGEDDSAREPTPEEYEELGLNPDDLGCVDAHPNRGGYVPTLSNGCYYDEGGCEWQG